MTIGTVTVDRRLRLSCPYGSTPDYHTILTIPLGHILVDLTVLGAFGALAFLVGATQLGVPQGAPRLFISALLLLFGPVHVLLMTGWFLRDQLRGRPGPHRSAQVR
jgi:hypothetical protein